MEKSDFIKRLAATTRSLNKKMHAIESVTGWQIHEHLSEEQELSDLLIEALEVPPWEDDIEIVYDYLRGDLAYVEMLALISEAQAAFDPAEYAMYSRAHDIEYGGGRP